MSICIGGVIFIVTSSTAFLPSLEATFTLAPAVFLRDFDYVSTGANYFPELVLDIINYGEQGNLTQATELYQQLVDLTGIITEKGNLIAAFKQAMPVLTGIDVGPPLEPIKALSNDEKEDQLQRLKKANVTIAVPGVLLSFSET